MIFIMTNQILNDRKTVKPKKTSTWHLTIAKNYIIRFKMIMFKWNTTIFPAFILVSTWFFPSFMQQNAKNMHALNYLKMFPIDQLTMYLMTLYVLTQYINQRGCILCYSRDCVFRNNVKWCMDRGFNARLCESTKLQKCVLLHKKSIYSLFRCFWRLFSKTNSLQRGEYDEFELVSTTETTKY